jgi:hypothetical protein
VKPQVQTPVPLKKKKKKPGNGLDLLAWVIEKKEL